jgi:hypothetical protein
MTRPPVDDEDHEIYDPSVPRVDAVAGPAHGIPFHIIKAETGRLTKEQQSMAEDLAENVAEAHDAADTDPAIAGDTVNAEDDPTASDPGSPAWEAIDAAKARETLVGLTAVKQLVSTLAGRENAESVAPDGDGSGYGNSCDLDAAGQALDFALGILAKYAVTEQAEADLGLAEIEAQAEALGLTKALDRTPVLKAGRVLSSANEAALRQILEQLTAILAQVDKAPTAAEGGEPIKVTKAADLGAMPGPLLELLEQFLAAAQAWQATQSTDTETPEEAAPVAEPTTAADPAADPATPVQAAAEPAATPETPADPAPAPVPADPSTAAAPADGVEDVHKALSGEGDLIARLTKSLEDTFAERLTKSMTDAVEAAVKPLEERIVKMEAQPAPGGPMLAGQLPALLAQMQSRGQDMADTGPLNPVQELQKHLNGISDPQQRAAVQALATEDIVRSRLFSQG